MAKQPKPDFLAILGILAAHRVDFIIVGGVAGALHGAPLTTFDLDVVHSREPGNIGRLAGALRELDARFRESMDKRIEPTTAHLASPGHQLLMTVHGPLDLLGAIGKGEDYEALIASTQELSVGAIRVRVLDLPALIRTKEELGRDKDKAALAVLRRTLEERGR